MIDIDISKELHGSDGDMDLEVKLHIEEGDFIALSGESGSGKTTLLKILAGIEEAEGRIEVDGEFWLDKKRFLPPQERRLGFVFQDYALFSNMSVEENLLFVNRDRELAERLLEITDLTRLRKRLPNSLSGGQQQRVALCRAMMNRPKLLLMDEPLSALDQNMKIRLQRAIVTLHKEFKMTTIMISHDLTGIYHLADRVVILNHGQIVDDGKPKDILLKGEINDGLTFEGKVLDIIRVNFRDIAIISIGQRVVKVNINSNETKNLEKGKRVFIYAKSFNVRY